MELLGESLVISLLVGLIVAWPLRKIVRLIGFGAISTVVAGVLGIMELAHKPWPLPLGLCRNRRSLLARRNLIDAIHLALASPAAKGETYVVADPSPLTLAEIVAALRAGEGRSAGLLPVPPPFIALGAVALGRTDEWQRLHGKMVVDPAKLLSAGWKPTLDTRAGLVALARANASSVAN